MFERELMISGLRRQNQLLNALIEELKKGPNLNFQHQRFYDEKTREVVRNLKKLRKMKDLYFQHRETDN